MSLVLTASPAQTTSTRRAAVVSANGCRRRLHRLATAPARARPLADADADGPGPSGRPPPPPKPKRRRLDEVAAELRPNLSRSAVGAFIERGRVTVDGRVVTKRGSPVKAGSVVMVIGEEPRWASRAGGKLDAALEAWGPKAAAEAAATTGAPPCLPLLPDGNPPVDPAGLVCLDAGLSTGGFTSCLLERGASRVYGVDVGRVQAARAKLGHRRGRRLGRRSEPRASRSERVTNDPRASPPPSSSRRYGQVAEKIRTDPRVVVMERTNLRHVALAGAPPDPRSTAAREGAGREGGPTLPEVVDLATLDLSFISLTKVLPAVVGVLRRPGAASWGGQVVALVKPQFEAGRDAVGAGGVVRDPAARAEAVATVVAAARALGLTQVGETLESPVPGNKGGNVEFLCRFALVEEAEG